MPDGLAPVSSVSGCLLLLRQDPPTRLSQLQLLGQLPALWCQYLWRCHSQLFLLPIVTAAADLFSCD